MTLQKLVPRSDVRRQFGCSRSRRARVPNKNSESGEKSRVLRFTAMMSLSLFPGSFLPSRLLTGRPRPVHLIPLGRGWGVSGSQFTPASVRQFRVFHSF
jgi:hypothetical protein